MSYLDWLPEELIFEIFYILKSDSINLANVNNRIGNMYNKLVDKIKNGYIEPDLAFGYEYDSSLKSEIYKFQVSGIFSKFIINTFRFILEFPESQTGQNLFIKFNGLDIIVSYFYDNMSAMNSCFDGGKIYLNIGVSQMKDGVCPDEAYIIAKNERNEYIYIEYSYLKSKEIKSGCGSFTTSPNWKEFWNKILDDKAKLLLLDKNGYNNNK